MIYVACDIEASSNDIETAVPLQLGYAAFEDTTGVLMRQGYDNIRWDRPPVISPWSMENLPSECLSNAGLRIQAAFESMAQDIWSISNNEPVTLIGHNFGSYDFPILRRHIPKELWDRVFNYRICDTAPVGRFLYQVGLLERPGSCADYCEQMGIYNVKHHHAMWDAVAEGQLYFKMVTTCRARLDS